MKAIAILNPRAGVASQRAHAALLRSAHWREVTVRITAAAGDARAFAQEAAGDGCDLVLSMGGDGTANETAWGLIGSRTALGVVPVGSGNGLARTLGIPMGPDAALALLAGAVLRRMDVGTINGRPFLNVAGAGFDAQVGVDFHEHGRRGGKRGILTYVRLSLRRTLSYRAAEWRLQAGEESFAGRAMIVAFVNGRQYGAGAVLAPGARLDDGLLDVVILEEAPALEMVWNATRLFLGTIEAYRRYRHMAAASATLTAEGPFDFHRDGEPEPATGRLEVGVLPLALRVLVPRAVAGSPTGPFGPGNEG